MDSRCCTNDIVVVGSCMIDFVSYATRLPKSGETIHGREFITNFGGKGANQCVAAAKLGGKTFLVARVGDDVWGPKYIENLKKDNVDTEFVQITRDSTSGIAQIIVADTGENQIVIVAGANNKLNTKDIEMAQDVISKSAVLILQLETSQDVAIKSMQLCRGISILNGAPALAEYNPELLKLPTIFCVNETEASTFTGLPVTDLREAELAAENLLTKGCNSVILTLGEQGALYLDKNEKFHVTSPSVKCVDTTGAGDSFIGSLAYLLANHKDCTMQEILKKACVAAADSVTRPGTQNSFPNRNILCATASIK